MWLASCQPTTRRESTPMTNEKNSSPPRRPGEVKSATHSAE